MFSRNVGDVLMRRVGVAGDRLGIQGRRIDVQAGARLEHMADDQADEHGEGGHHLEVDDRLQADPPDLLGVGQLGDADDHGDEHDRRDDHPHQLDEAVAERLHLHRDRRPEMAERRRR